MKSAYEIAEETYEEIKKEIESRKRDAETQEKRYYTPFAIGQEADEIPARCEQNDIQEQTVITWLNTAPHREYLYLQHHVLEPKNGVGGNPAPYFDGAQYCQWDCGRYSIKKGEITAPAVTCYNFNDRLQKSFYATSPFTWKETMENSTNELFLTPCALFDIWGMGYENNKGQHAGFRGMISSVAILGAIVKTHDEYDTNIFQLWEEMMWKKADIKKLKANKWLAKKPTLIREKKAEIKKIKADAWPCRALPPFSLRTLRWSRWKYREIWALREEIKKLKKEGRGEERIGEIEEPKEVFANRSYRQYHSVYSYPYILDREKRAIKSIEEYKKEIEKAKEDIRRMREEMRKRLKEAIKRGNEWLKWYRREWKKKRNEVDNYPRIKELKRRWKEYKKWILENSKKYNLHYQVSGHACYATGAYAKPKDEKEKEIQEVLSKLYIPTETDYEREFFQEVRGDARRENMLPDLVLRKWSHNDVARYLGNRKGYGIGRLVRSRWFDEIISKEARKYNDFNLFVFRTAHFNKGIGEWKELTRDVRKKIPYPLVYRPIRDKKGYTILETGWEYATTGRWECRPLHPADAWKPWRSALWTRMCTHVLWIASKFVIKHQFWTSGGGYHYRPFDRWLRPHSFINRFLVGFMLRRY